MACARIHEALRKYGEKTYTLEEMEELDEKIKFFDLKNASTPSLLEEMERNFNNDKFKPHDRLIWELQRLAAIAEKLLIQRNDRLSRIIALEQKHGEALCSMREDLTAAEAEMNRQERRLAACNAALDAVEVPTEQSRDASHPGLPLDSPNWQEWEHARDSNQWNDSLAEQWGKGWEDPWQCSTKEEPSLQWQTEMDAGQWKHTEGQRGTTQQGVNGNGDRWGQPEPMGIAHDAGQLMPMPMFEQAAIPAAGSAPIGAPAGPLATKPLTAAMPTMQPFAPNRDGSPLQAGGPNAPWSMVPELGAPGAGTAAQRRQRPPPPPIPTGSVPPSNVAALSASPIRFMQPPGLAPEGRFQAVRAPPLPGASSTIVPIDAEGSDVGSEKSRPWDQG